MSNTWQPPTAPTTPVKPRRKIPTVVIVAFVGLVLVAFATIGGDGEPSADDLEHRAFSACTELVRDRLKSPSSASFRNFFEDDGEVVVSGSGDGPYTVTSSVDAQNGFGADIRSNFRCVVELDGDVWRLRDMTID